MQGGISTLVEVNGLRSSPCMTTTTTKAAEPVCEHQQHDAHAGTMCFPTMVCVRQEKQILDDLDQGDQLPVLLWGSQPHQQPPQPFLQLLLVNHGL